jgi:hypothetical protein
VTKIAASFRVSPTALRRRDRVSHFRSSGQSLWGASQTCERNVDVFGLGHGALGSRLGRGAGAEAGTESPACRMAVLSAARGSLVLTASSGKRLLPRNPRDHVAVALAGPALGPEAVDQLGCVATHGPELRAHPDPYIVRLKRG